MCRKTYISLWLLFTASLRSSVFYFDVRKPKKPELQVASWAGELVVARDSVLKLGLGALGDEHHHRKGILN